MKDVIIGLSGAESGSRSYLLNRSARVLHLKLSGMSQAASVDICIKSSHTLADDLRYVGTVYSADT